MSAPEHPAPKGEAPAAPRKEKTPDTYLILAVLAVLAFALTYFVPYGIFDTVTAENGRERLDPATYQVVDGVSGAPFFGTGDEVGLANMLYEGFVADGTVGLIGLLFIIGGAFGMILRTGAFDRALGAIIPEDGRASEPLIAGLFVAFSLAGAVFGMSEEAVVFCFIVVPALMRAGYDSLTGVFTVFVGTQVGFATSWMNPFNVIVAQGVADLPPLSGLGLRVVMWGVFTGLAALWLWRYARSVRLNPEKSLSYKLDAGLRAESLAQAEKSKAVTFSLGDALVLATVALGIVWVGYGVAVHGYYLAEISAQFFVIGAVAAVIGRVFGLNGVDGNDLMEAFREGATHMIPAILVIAAAKGIVALLGGSDPSTPSILNTMLQGAATVTGGLPSWAAAWGMLFVQGGINFVVVSGSGQAALTMPLMAPLADLLGVSRQTAVLAFQLGDGITNIFVPASGALLACLGAARLDWVTWARFIWKPLVYLFVLASGFVLAAGAIGYA